MMVQIGSEQDTDKLFVYVSAQIPFLTTAACQQVAPNFETHFFPTFAERKEINLLRKDCNNISIIVTTIYYAQTI